MILDYIMGQPSIPNGWFLKDMLVFNELDQRGYISKGFEVVPPSLAAASAQTMTEHRLARQRFLHSFNTDIRVTVQWTVTSDYRRELNYYQAQTERLNPRPWPRQVRTEKYETARQLMLTRSLRRVLPRIFISKRLPSLPSIGLGKASLVQQNEMLLDQLSAEFGHWKHMLDLCFGSLNAVIRPMTNADHFLHYQSFLNPSYASLENPPGIESFDPNLTIQQNCWPSAVRGLDPRQDAGFYFDGNYHNIIALKTLPKRLLPNIHTALTELPFLDYTITLNMIPLDADKIIEQEESKIEALKGHIRDYDRQRDKDSADFKNERVSALNKGDVLPFNLEYIVHLWDTSKEQLRSKSGNIKDAIKSMEQAMSWDIVIPTTSQNLWLSTWPGWSWSDYQGYRLPIESDQLADLLPLEGSFTGSTSNPEFIEFGQNGSLVGWENFRGNSPQHAAMFGKSGSGKSAFMTDLLSQTDPYYGYTLIVEEGLTYWNYCRVMGIKPYVIHPDSNHTLNYFDTGGLPLSSEHLAVAKAIVSQMMGQAHDPDVQTHREAVISQYIVQLYENKFEGWSLRNPKKVRELARLAVALPRYRLTLSEDDQDCSFSSLYALFRQAQLIPDSPCQKLLDDVTESEVTDALHDHHRAIEIRNLSFAEYKPQDFPQHGQLYEMLRDMPLPEHDRAEITVLADRLFPWCAGGPYGCLFDGVTNVDLAQFLVHFELGKVPEAVSEMKTIIAFLILNQVRQIILAMPRHLKKRIVFEEVGRLLNVAGGAKLVAECYAQMRKFSTWIISIIQQYATFVNSPVRPFIMGNSGQYYFLKQDDLEDIRSQTRDINGFPESLGAAIMNFPMPSEQPIGQRYSSVAFFQTAAARPICGVTHIYASPDLLTVAETDHNNPAAKEKMQEILLRLRNQSKST